MFLSVIRDDDNDKSDDEDDERIDFSVNTQARERIKIQNDFLAAEHGNYLCFEMLMLNNRWSYLTNVAFDLNVFDPDSRSYL